MNTGVVCMIGGQHRRQREVRLGIRGVEVGRCARRGNESIRVVGEELIGSSVGGPPMLQLLLSRP